MRRLLVGELEALVRAHPLCEGLRAQQMLALYGAGRPSDALAAYRAAYAALTDGLGVEPLPRLRALEGAILRHELGDRGDESELESRAFRPAPTKAPGREPTWHPVLVMLRQPVLR